MVEALHHMADASRLADHGLSTGSDVPGRAGRLAHDDMRQLRLACVQARARYPGPVGELIEREIGAYRNFGHRFGDDGLVPRIVAELLAGSATSTPR